MSVKELTDLKVTDLWKEINGIGDFWEMQEEAVRDFRITMCGVVPATIMLIACKELGAQNARLVDYATSAETSGDYEHVVGYAGMIVQ